MRELATNIKFDVPLAELETDPHPTYAAMRKDKRPITFIPETGMVVVTTWDLVDYVVGNDHLFGPTEVIFDTVYGRPNILSLSGDPHMAMRNVINPPFRPRAIRVIRDTVLRQIAIKVVEEVKDRGWADAPRDILEPISQRAIGNLIGLGAVDDATIARWFHWYGAYLVDVGRSPDVTSRGEMAKEEVRRFLERQSDQPLDDIAGTALYHMLKDGMPDGSTRGLDEVMGSLGVLIVGGIQEPAHAAASALLGILSSPEAHQRMATAPRDWSARALEEGLRWITPFGIGHRRVRADTIIGEILFEEGTEVAIARDSANRDPLRYNLPERYDIERPELAHMSFGSSGPHFCIGHAAARSLGQVVLEEMFERLPGLRLDPAMQAVVHGWNVRGPKTLPIVWDI